jgi:hypothetical protein
MPNAYAVPALVRKQVELTGEVERTEAELARLREALAHVEAVLRLFEPDKVVDSLRRRRPARSPVIANMQGRALDILRSTPEPLSSWQMARRLVEQDGLPGARIPRVDKALAKYLRRNDGLLVERAGDTPPRRWRLAQAA